MEIAVCDDNALFLEEIVDQIDALRVAESISKFSNLETFMFTIDAGKRYDVVLMDIEWHDKVAGMDAAAELYKLCPEAKVIYITGRVERYSQEIFLQRSNLSGYLTKPVNMELLKANLQKVADALAYEVHPTLVLRQKGSPISVPLREICYIESDNHIVQVHTEAEKVTAYERLETILSSLPAGFYHCHKSYIVNMNQIRRFQSGEILLKNGMRVPVSRSKYHETKDAYFSFIGQSFQ